jgi:uncharacterized RDD family membrane protein YckC
MENYKDQFTPDGSNPAPLEADEPQGPVPAGFNERFLAYAVDAFPFVAGAFFTLSLLIKNGTLPSTYSAGVKWKLLWIAGYVVYETALSSGGRATLGKYLLGIRVKAADGSDLSVLKAFIRAIAYFVSSAPLNLGYLLALLTPGRRALHDYLGGSRVISIRERSAAAETLVVAAAWACMALLTASWVKHNFLQLSPADKRQVAMAQLTVSKVAKLEDIYKGMYGSYTEDLKRLAALTGNPGAVRNEILRTIAPNTLSLATDGRAYIVSAKAKDRRNTAVSVTSMPQKR